MERSEGPDIPPSFLSRLEEICAIDSPTGDLEGNDRCVSLIEDWARAADCTCRRLPTPAGSHLIATLSGTGRSLVLLIGHSDTVYPAGTAAHRPVSRDGDHAVGPGVADMKGGLLLGIAALEFLAPGPRDEFGSIELHVLPDEEARRGPPLHLDAMRGADAAIGLECGRPDGAFVGSRDAATWMTLVATGDAGHAGAPRAEETALQILLKELEHIRRVSEATPRLRAQPTRVYAPAPDNGVAAMAEAIVDIRAERAADIEWLVDEVRAANSAGGRLEVTANRGFPAMSFEAPLAARAQACLEASGLPGHQAHAAGASDTCWSSEVGIPSVDGFGPVGGDDHGAQEWIDVATIPARIDALAALCTAIGSMDANQPGKDEDADAQL